MSIPSTLRIGVRKFAPFESSIRDQWNAFETEHHTGFTLEVVALELVDLYNSLFNNAGLARGEWDIAFVSTDWVAMALEQNAVLDLSSMIQADPPSDYPYGWPESVLRLQRSGSKIAGLPYHDGPECLIYRLDLFEDTGEQAEFYRRHGYELQPPRTWKEFEDVARFFYRPERGLYGTALARLPDGHNSVYDFILQLWTRGGEIADARGRLCLNTPLVLESLQYLRELTADTIALHPGSEGMDSVSLGATFAAGELAMMVNWFGFAVATITDESAHATSRSWKNGIGVAKLPAGPNGHSASLNVYWLLALGAGSAHHSISYSFLKHCMLPAMDKLLTLNGAIGCRRSTWQDPDVLRRIPIFGKMKVLHAAARELPSTSQWPKIAGILDELVSSATRGNHPLEDTLTVAQAHVDRLFPEPI